MSRVHLFAIVCSKQYNYINIDINGTHASTHTKCSSAHKLKNWKNFALQHTKKNFKPKGLNFIFAP